ncbi:MAG TPA: class I SAM-dependent methyltransferase, partial [Anaerolineales bacterium]|nr:class I SAM-dependent methyltransferase [Anaerolineales bacterium]
MERILEPELMEDMEQALAYSHADFATSHQMRVTWFQERFGKDNQPASILDLCCGGGDMTFRFARAFSHSRIIAVDGSQAMLDIAQKDVQA